MRTGKGLRYVKRVRSKGRQYGYFDTGQRDGDGKRIYAPIGRMDDPAFGARYAAMLGRRTVREKRGGMLTVPALVGLFQKSQDYKNLAASSRVAYDIYLKAFAEAMPTAPAGEIERRDILLLMDKRADRPGSANLMLGAIGSLYKWAKDRHVTNDPCRGIARLDTGEHEPWPEHVLMAALDSDDANIRLAVHLLYYTAQRISDVCAMRWSDIRNNRIAVTQKKTGKALDLPIHAALRDLLSRTPRMGLFILSDEGGRPFGTMRIRRRIAKWAARQGVKVVAHGLRKNAVNALLEAECSTAEASAISGQSLRMVEHYARMRDQKKLSSAAILKWENRK